jgi:hypothetical protein
MIGRRRRALASQCKAARIRGRRRGEGGGRDGEYAWAAWVRKWSYSVSVIRTDTARYKIHVGLYGNCQSGHGPRATGRSNSCIRWGADRTAHVHTVLACIASPDQHHQQWSSWLLTPVHTPEQDASRSTGATSQRVVRPAPLPMDALWTVVWLIVRSKAHNFRHGLSLIWLNLIVCLGRHNPIYDRVRVSSQAHGPA